MEYLAEDAALRKSHQSTGRASGLLRHCPPAAATFVLSLLPAFWVFWDYVADADREARRNGEVRLLSVFHLRYIRNKNLNLGEYLDELRAM